MANKAGAAAELCPRIFFLHFWIKEISSSKGIRYTRTQFVKLTALISITKNINFLLDKCCRSHLSFSLVVNGTVNIRSLSIDISTQYPITAL